MKLKAFLHTLNLYLCHVERVQTKRQLKLFKNIWTSVWIDEHYAEKDTLIEIQDHYQSLNDYSTDFLLYFLWIPIGTMRLIWGNKNIQLPVFSDFNIQKQYDEKNSVEYTLLTLKKNWRGLNYHAVMMLMGKGYKEAKKKGFNTMVASADQRLFYFMRRKLKMPFKKIGEEKFYEGSITIPCLFHSNEFDEIIPGTFLERFFM